MDIKTLIARANEAGQKAYAPYSHYPVGAALLTTGGVIFTGCNVENAAYPAGICAERVALVKAVSEGYRQFTALAVVTRNAGAPCGMCRQMLYEFAPDLRIIIADQSGQIALEIRLADLLPHGFGPAELAP